MLVAGVLAIVILCIRVGTDLVVFNDSTSIPRGFYARSDAAPRRGAIVTVRAVDVAPDYALMRDFADLGDRFIKRVAGADGDVVCAEGALVTINGERAAERVARDSAGRALPTWSGCRRLRNEVFLLGDTPDSFDGRYWGPTPMAFIEGTWRPLRRPRTSGLPSRLCQISDTSRLAR